MLYNKNIKEEEIEQRREGGVLQQACWRRELAAKTRVVFPPPGSLQVWPKWTDSLLTLQRAFPAVSSCRSDEERSCQAEIRRGVQSPGLLQPLANYWSLVSVCLLCKMKCYSPQPYRVEAEIMSDNVVYKRLVEDLEHSKTRWMIVINSDCDDFNNKNVSHPSTVQSLKSREM